MTRLKEPSSPTLATQNDGQEAFGEKRSMYSQDSPEKRPKVEVIDFDHLSQIDIEDLCADDFKIEDEERTFAEAASTETPSDVQPKYVDEGQRKRGNLWEVRLILIYPAAAATRM